MPDGSTSEVEYRRGDRWPLNKEVNEEVACTAIGEYHYELFIFRLSDVDSKPVIRYLRNIKKKRLDGPWTRSAAFALVGNHLRDVSSDVVNR